MNCLLGVFFVALALTFLHKELQQECVEHGKNVGKKMQWNVFGGCEETR